MHWAGPAGLGAGGQPPPPPAVRFPVAGKGSCVKEAGGLEPVHLRPSHLELARKHFIGSLATGSLPLGTTILAFLSSI